VKIVFYSIIILIVALAGWFVGKLSSVDKKHNPSEREASFRIIVESYTPSCSELEKEGVFKLLSQGSTKLYLEVTSEDYKVVGIKEEPGHLPLYWWAGASRQGVISQKCSKP